MSFIHRSQHQAAWFTCWASTVQGASCHPIQLMITALGLIEDIPLMNRLLGHTKAGHGICKLPPSSVMSLSQEATV